MADISDIDEKGLPLMMFVVLLLFWDIIKRDLTQKAVLVIDELWKLISISGNEKVADYVLEIFKIIRGYGGSVIAATQDFADCIALKDGFYANGMVNNSAIKIMLKSQPMEAEAL